MQPATPLANLSLRLDPWASYGVEAPAMGTTEDPTEAEALDVELPADAWRPIHPVDPPTFQRLLFVDGVRRIDARLVGRRGDKTFLGAFGSWGVGAVRVEAETAHFERSLLGRTLALGAGETVDEAITINHALQFVPVSTADDTPDGPVNAIHRQMRLAEERLGTELADDPSTLVLGDGPLTFEHPVRGAAVGYVKRIMSHYLPATHLPFLFTLPAGARTPLFALGGRFARYAWFVRLAAPRRGDAETSGLVRLEVAQGVGAAQACRLADATTAVAPTFASIRGLHPRAPQNLLPIGALEAWLRRRLGDPGVVLRQLETFLARSAPANG